MVVAELPDSSNLLAVSTRVFTVSMLVWGVRACIGTPLACSGCLWRPSHWAFASGDAVGSGGGGGCGDGDGPSTQYRTYCIYYTQILILKSC